MTNYEKAISILVMAALADQTISISRSAKYMDIMIHGVKPLYGLRINPPYTVIKLDGKIKIPDGIVNYAGIYHQIITPKQAMDIVELNAPLIFSIYEHRPPQASGG